MKLSKYILTGLVLAAMTACDKDGDIIYVDQIIDPVVDGNQADIVLDKDMLDALALSIYWNENGDITLSDPAVAPPKNAVTNVLQLGADEAFATVVEETMPADTYVRQYTCRELNSIVSRLGFEGGVQTPLYIRVKSVVGQNVAPHYSNVLTVNVTSYYIDMTTGFYLDASQTDTGRTLYSPESNGIYTGFIGASSWENWWLREGDSTTWGNDGVTGTPFVLGNTTTGNTVWNFWYPGLSGCYYTIVNTNINEWSALLIPALTLSGDVQGEMTFNRKQCCWTFTYTSAAAGTVNVTIGGTGMQYNVATGTDDSAAIPTTVGFGGTADNVTFGEAASAIALSVPAGETTITLNLFDPRGWTLSAEAGGGAPVEVIPPVIYLSGVYGDWTFDWSLKLYDEDNKNYGGVLPVKSQWGYRIYTEAGAWDDYYTMADGGNAFEGNLTKEGTNNIEAPAEGMYLFDVSLGALKYKLTSVSSVSYAGLNDDWSLTPMTATETPSVYTAVVTKSANTPWGVKIIINDNWDLYFGGNGTPGELALFHEGFEGDNELENGTYTLTVDLAKGTYNYSK